MTEEVGNPNLLTCDDCGEKNETVKYTCCPFALEINGEDIPMNLCDDCHQQRADDI
jgi:hypothetical protein